MGGTFPILGQYFVRRPWELAKTGTTLYAINTCGAILGTFLAGFLLPPLLGFKNSYLLAILISTAIGLLAIATGRGETVKPPAINNHQRNKKAGMANNSMTSALLYLLAFASGFIALALQVLWTRKFNQILDNTVYTFSMILIDFLLALAIGSAVANRLCRSRFDPTAILGWLLALSGLACLVTPMVYISLTGGMNHLILNNNASWSLYLVSTFFSIGLVILPPGVLLGSVFPYLIKAAEKTNLAPGHILGRLISINTLGAILGSLCAGFLFLNILGLWASINLASVAYLVLAFYVAFQTRTLVGQRLTWGLGGIILLLIFIVGPAQYPLVYLDPKKNIELLGVIEGSNAIASVIKYKNIKEPDYIRLFLNNNYSPGGTKPTSLYRQIAQTDIPLSLHPNPKSLFYLGLGTGITAARAPEFNVEKVTVCEIVPEVVEASQRFFSDHVARLYNDPRVNIVIEDGRNYLLGTREKYDLIIADLFLPWKIGIGNLYTREHFQTVKSRLKENGLFFQWLALYQLSQDEFSIIAKTMLEVFDQVTLWRNSILVDRPTMALVGHNSAAPLDPGMVLDNFRRMNKEKLNLSEESILATFLMTYAGNLTKAKALFQHYPANTDNYPFIEFSSPRTFRNRLAGREQDLTGEKLYFLLERILNTSPPEQDPFLKNISRENLWSVRAGLNLYASGVFARSDPQKSFTFTQLFQENMPQELKKVFLPKNK